MLCIRIISPVDLCGFIALRCALVPDVRFATPHATVCVRLIDKYHIALAGGFVWRHWQVREEEARPREQRAERQSERENSVCCGMCTRSCLRAKVLAMNI